MTQDRHSVRGRDAKMHPIFFELYLSNDDSNEAGEERRQERARARARRKVLERRVKRRA